MTTTPFEPTTSLAEVIDSVQTQMVSYDANATEFAAMTEQLIKLYALLPKPPAPAPVEKKQRVSPEAVLSAATNLTGILLVLNYEKLGVITSKAFGLLVKSRL